MAAHLSRSSTPRFALSTIPSVRPNHHIYRALHSTTPRAGGSPFFQLPALSASREAQHFAKEHKRPRTDYVPSIELIRSSEVDPFGDVPGAKKYTSPTKKLSSSGKFGSKQTTVPIVKPSAPGSRGSVPPPASAAGSDSLAVIAEQQALISALEVRLARSVTRVIGLEVKASKLERRNTFLVGILSGLAVTWGYLAYQERKLDATNRENLRLGRPLLPTTTFGETLKADMVWIDSKMKWFWGNLPSKAVSEVSWKIDDLKEWSDVHRREIGQFLGHWEDRHFWMFGGGIGIAPKGCAGTGAFDEDTRSVSEEIKRERSVGWIRGLEEHVPEVTWLSSSGSSQAGDAGKRRSWSSLLWSKPE